MRRLRDDPAPHLVVRYDHRLVIEGLHVGGEQVYGLDRACDSRDFDGIAHVERPKHHDQNAAGKIAQRIM